MRIKSRHTGAMPDGERRGLWQAVKPVFKRGGADFGGQTILKLLLPGMEGAMQEINGRNWKPCCPER